MSGLTWPLAQTGSGGGGGGNVTLTGTEVLSNKTIVAPVIEGATTITSVAIASDTIDVTEADGTITISVDTDLEFSDEPAVGVLFGATVYNSATTTKNLGIPESSANGDIIDSIEIPPLSELRLAWIRSANTLTLFGAPQRRDFSGAARGVRVLIMGASREMRANVSFGVSAGNVSTSGDTITVTLSLDHEAATGSIWYIVSQQDINAGSYDAQTVGYGQITRTGAQSFTIPRIFGPTSGTSASEFWAIAQQRFSHQSPFVYANSRLNCGLRFFANFSAGANNSTDILGHCYKMAQRYVDSFDHMDVTLGTGNDVLNAIANSTPKATFVAATIGRVREMLDWLAFRGKTFTFQGIPATETSSGIATAYGLALDQALEDLIDDRYQGKGEYLRLAPVDVLPGSANRDPALVNTGEGVHNNAAGAEVVGMLMADAISRLRPIPPRPPISFSPDDRLSQSAESDQLIEAGWVNTGRNPNSSAGGYTGDTDFVSTANGMWNDFGVVAATNSTSSASIATGIVAEVEGFGYTQTMTITSTGGANLITLALTGDPAGSGTLLVDRVTVGSSYDGHVRIVVLPSDALILREWSVRVMGTVSGNLCCLAGAIENAGAFGDDDAPHGKELVLWLPEHTIPTGTTSYYIEFKYLLRTANSGKTVYAEIDRARLDKVA